MFSKENAKHSDRTIGGNRKNGYNRGSQTKWRIDRKGKSSPIEISPFKSLNPSGSYNENGTYKGYRERKRNGIPSSGVRIRSNGVNRNENSYPNGVNRNENLFECNEKGIHFGDRGDAFVKMLRNVIRIGGKEDVVEYLTTGDRLKVMGEVFTSSYINEHSNYEPYEMRGDGILGGILVNYFYERFPELEKSDGVKKIARLKILWGSRNALSKIGEKLGFFPFITAPKSLRERCKKALLEDVLESVIGAIQREVRKWKRIGVGFGLVYTIMKRVLNKERMGLRRSDLYDYKTRVKEIFDRNRSLGKMIWERKREDGDGDEEYGKSISILKCGRIVIGIGEGGVKGSADQNACREALRKLKEMGYNEDEEEEEKRREMGDVNEMKYRKDRSKYGEKYYCTDLCMYAKKGDLSGVERELERGGNVYILDSDGSTCLDLVCINWGGDGEEIRKREIIKKILVEKGVKMGKDVEKMMRGK